MLMYLNKQPPFPPLNLSMHPINMNPLLYRLTSRFSRHLHHSPFWCSSKHPTWHPSTAMFTIPPLDLSKPSESGIISKTSDPCCTLWCSDSWLLPCWERNLIFSSASCPWSTQHHRVHQHHADYHTSPLRLCSICSYLPAHTSYPSPLHPVIYTCILSCSDKPLIPIYHPFIHPSIHWVSVISLAEASEKPWQIPFKNIMLIY